MSEPVNLAAYRRQRPRVIKLKLSHAASGFAAVDVQAALSDLIESFHAPLALDMRWMRGEIFVLSTGETIDRRELNRRYLIYLLSEMGEPK